MMTHDEAARWLSERGKKPKHEKEQYGNGYFWRWVLADPPTSEGAHDLPKAVFDRLVSADATPAPWLFWSYQAAMFAATRAVRDASTAGSLPP